MMTAESVVRGDQSTSRKPGSLSLAGGGLSTVCFFLPWVQVSCMGQTRAFTGSELAEQSSILWLVLLCSAAIVGCIVYFRSKGRLPEAKPYVLGAAAVGLGVMVLKYVQLRNGIDTDVGRISAPLVGLSFRFGSFGTIAGLILAGYDAVSTFHKEQLS